MSDKKLNIESIKSDVAAHSLNHVAFIMDGNGRWAKKRGMPRVFGHKHGVDAFRRVVDACDKFGIKCTTVYAFSTENWKRPQAEVEALMKLFDENLSSSCPPSMSIKIIGDKSGLDLKLREKIKALEERTAGREKTVNIAINYGSRAEIVSAVNSLIESGAKSVLEEDITKALYTADCPELDLIVRTGGDIRISNFLLWQAAYAELYFSDKLWPDMDEYAVAEAIESFCQRKRRYGGLDK